MANKKDLSYFMHSTEPEIVKYPAPEGFNDKTGKRLELEFRILSESELRTIRNHWRERKLIKDHGRPMVVNGAPVYDETYDSGSALQEMLVESLVYPDLKDEDLMAYYGVVDANEMPSKVFPKFKDLNYVSRAFNIIHGFMEEDEDEEEGEKKPNDVDVAKN
ncbi:MAG: hypothetical protein IJ643_11700 [Eubacterium sp.]|nr:hypothetical protein [Eubacterium sp.]MBR1761909.1 hypothetical protein [Eubacterium sp.]